VGSGHSALSTWPSAVRSGPWQEAEGAFPCSSVQVDKDLRVLGEDQESTDGGASEGERRVAKKQRGVRIPWVKDSLGNEYDRSEIDRQPHPRYVMALKCGGCDRLDPVSGRRGAEPFEESGTQRIRVRQAEFRGDGQGLGPRGAGRVRAIVSVVDVAEADETGGFAQPVPRLVEKVDGLLVAVDGLGVVTEPVVNVAEAVLDMRLSVEVTGLLGEFESLKAVLEGLLVVAELGEDPANVVESSGLSGSVDGGPVVGEAGVGMAERLLMPALVSGHPGQVLMDAGLPGLAADLTEQFQRPQVVGARVCGTVQSVLGEAETSVGLGLPDDIAMEPGCVQRGGMRRDQRPPIAVPVEIGRQRRGELPGVAVETGCGCLLHGGEQGRTLGGEPNLCMLMA